MWLVSHSLYYLIFVYSNVPNTLQDMGMETCHLPPVTDCMVFLDQAKARFKSSSNSSALSLVENPRLNPDRCYILYDQYVYNKFSDAKSACESSGGMLPWSNEIDSDATVLMSLYANIVHNRMYLGLYKDNAEPNLKKGWSWVCPNQNLSIEADSSINWFPTEPNDNITSNDTSRMGVFGYIYFDRSANTSTIFDHAVERLKRTRRFMTICIAFMHQDPSRASKEPGGHSKRKFPLVVILMTMMILFALVIVVGGIWRVRSLTKKLKSLSADDKMKAEEARKVEVCGTGSDVGKTADFFSHDGTGTASNMSVSTTRTTID